VEAVSVAPAGITALIDTVVGVPLTDAVDVVFAEFVTVR
jgi:hypothetical protein